MMKPSELIATALKDLDCLESSRVIRALVDGANLLGTGKHWNEERTHFSLEFLASSFAGYGLMKSAIPESDLSMTLVAPLDVVGKRFNARLRKAIDKLGDRAVRKIVAESYNDRINKRDHDTLCGINQEPNLKPWKSAPK